MKYNEIINEVKELYPSEYSDTQFKKWLGEAEDVILRFLDGYQSESVELRQISDLNEEAVAPPPYDRMYIDFIMAHIALHQHDDESYSRYMGVFNSRYRDFTKWYIRKHSSRGYKWKNWI